MSVSAWSEAVPSGTSLVGLFPPYARAVFAAISEGMATEHYWNASGGGSDASAGDLLPGASRAFFAAQSASSLPSQGIGRAFFASDVTRLFLYNSTGTYLGGTPYLAEHATSAGSNYWVRFTGSYGTTATSGVTTVTFPTSFISTPTVFQSLSSVIWVVGAANISQSAFSSFFSQVAAGSSSITVTWEALGLVSSASY